MDSSELRARRYASEAAAGEVLYRPAHGWLRTYVLGYSGVEMGIALPVQRRLLPFGGVSVLLDLVSPTRLPTGRRRRSTLTFPVSGLHDRPIVFGQMGRHDGVGIGLTPAGAYALFGVPLRDLANTRVELRELIGNRAEQLAERLAQARGWPARFALLDSILPTWIQQGPSQPDLVSRAWLRLCQSSGQVSVAKLAADASCSSRYLEMLFCEHIGLSPKTAARVLRFQRAVRLLGSPSRFSLAQVAAACGYADQAHLNLDFRQFVGRTPTELVAANATAPGGRWAQRRAGLPGGQGGPGGYGVLVTPPPDDQPQAVALSRAELLSE